MRTRLVAGVALFLGVTAGCEREVEVPEGTGSGGSGGLPQALMIRFQEVQGEGSARESWELEVLQLGGDVRVRGSVRTGGVSVPLLDQMNADEFTEFWWWLRDFPLDGARLAENADVPDEGWRKSLQVDVVLDEETRWQSRSTWRRPLVDAEWVGRIEQRLHGMTLALARREADRREQAADNPSPAAPLDESVDELPDVD